MLVRLDADVEHDAFSVLSMILCYPHPEEKEVLLRIAELRCLGVEAIVPRGRVLLSGVWVLGKGNVGLVVACRSRGLERALKIRRVDADRRSMSNEAVMLKLANEALVGPRLIGSSENFLVMELAEGESITEWLRGQREEGIAKRVLKDLLLQCRRLDEIGLDHGELSKAHRHVVVDVSYEVRLIDFETASTLRHPSNVTSIAHYLFFNRLNSKLIRDRIGEIDHDSFLSKLRCYKRTPDEENFEEILSFLGL